MARTRFAILITIWLVLATQAAWVHHGATRETGKNSEKNEHGTLNKSELSGNTPIAWRNQQHTLVKQFSNK